MTVAELIEKLSQIEDKTLSVQTFNQTYGGDVPVKTVEILKQRKSVGFKNERIETWVGIR
jgi:hypothetical protein